MLFRSFLVFGPLRQRRSNNSFDGNDNIGAKVIKDVLIRNGVEVGYCSPATAKDYQLVLVSLTSTYDVYAFYQSIALLPSWQPNERQFKVLGGGFGIQNPTAIRHYIDYAAFGRAESWISSIVKGILGGNEVLQHDSLMHLPDMHHVKIAQADQLYPHKVGDYQEAFTGCPLKCKFCHFTFARKHQGPDGAYGEYVQTTLTGGGTPELTWDQLFTWGEKAGRIRVAIDGFSERLRYIYGKRISCDDIVEGIEAIGQYGGITTLLVYNIANFPTEADEDRQELYQILRRANPDDRVILVLQSTPFRPSLATPMQWEPVALFPDWSKRRTEVIDERSNFRAVHSFTLETPWSHLMSVIAERATPDTDELFHNICFAPQLQRGKHSRRLKIVQDNYNLTPYVKEYDFDEDHPAWFLESYIDNSVIKKMARKMRKQAKKSTKQPGWLPGGRGSIVTARLMRA